MNHCNFCLWPRGVEKGQEGLSSKGNMIMITGEYRSGMNEEDDNDHNRRWRVMRCNKSKSQNQDLDGLKRASLSPC